MATATENTSDGFSCQDIQTEVRNFLRGTTHDGKTGNGSVKIGSESLSHSALFLLRTLPAARHAVLEHLCNVCDEAVNSHILEIKLGHSLTAEEGCPNLDVIIQDACGILLGFIKNSPEAWAPIISAWSLELLGHISSKFSDRRGVPHSDSLNELLQLWMTLAPTKSLIEVATECFAAMVGGAPEVCVDALLIASVKYSPHFDWVVAHIGSCFPNTIINRVLMCGLKDFCAHGRKQSDMEVTSHDNIPKMESVVGILGHLASKHGQDIRQALMSLFEASLHDDCEPMKLYTVPFLLQLASMSPMLLQVLTSDMVKMLTPSVLNKLHHQLTSSSNYQDVDSLVNLIVHLVMKCDVGSDQVIMFLLDSAAPIRNKGAVEGDALRPEVEEVCKRIMDELTFELQHVVYNRRQEHAPEIPLLATLGCHVTELSRCLMASGGQRADWLTSLLNCVAVHTGEGCASDILCFILSEARQVSQLNRFLQMQRDMEISLPEIMSYTIDKAANMLQPYKQVNRFWILSNLHNLLKWEKCSSVKQICRNTVRQCLQQHVPTLAVQLSHPSTDVMLVALKTLSAMGLPATVEVNVSTYLCSAIISVFFRILHNKERRKVLSVVQLCKVFLRDLNRASHCQVMLLRFLLEGVLLPENAVLFGSKTTPTPVHSALEKSWVSLCTENKKHGLSLTLPRSHSSVFHAGVIGEGLKVKRIKLSLSKDEILRNKKCFLDVLWSCSHQQIGHHDNGAKDESMETDTESPSPGKQISDDVGRKIADILVELVSPDVMYNGIAWPEEEFIRATVERDLYIARKFNENPVLWDILENLSGCSAIICHCTPILRSVTATLLTHFESSREKFARNYPKQMETACHLLQCLRKGRQLAPPLCYVGDLFPMLSSHELYRILQTIWQYIKENPPCYSNERSVTACDSKYTELIQSIIHKNMDTMGHLYTRFFAVSAATTSAS